LVTQKFAPFILVAAQISCTNADLGRENTQEYLNGFRPTQVRYASDPMVFYQGNQITPQIPNIVSRQSVTSCSSVPALPAGLALDNSSCKISGTPTLAQAAADYTITAANDMGSHSVQINIRISTPPPSNLVYTGSPFAFVKTAPITTVNPTVTGAVTSCTASPALPGLTLDNTTCAISGSPTTSQLQTTHTITASNAEGSTSTTIDLTIFRVLFISAASIAGSAMANSGEADNLCNNDGNKPAGTGSYKAMIAGWGTRRACSSGNCITSGMAENLDWVLLPNTEYRRRDLATRIMTTNGAGIFAFGTLAATLVPTPLPGGSPSGYWTGMTGAWTTNGSGTCGGNWSTAVSVGAYGVITQTNSTALFSSTGGNCNTTSAYLACAQQ